MTVIKPSYFAKLKVKHCGSVPLSVHVFFLLKTCVCLFLFIFTPHYSGSGEFKCSSIWIIWKGQSSWLDLPDGASEQK